MVVTKIFNRIYFVLWWLLFSLNSILKGHLITTGFYGWTLRHMRCGVLYFWGRQGIDPVIIDWERTDLVCLDI